jgi:hypothetical protein
MKKVKKSTAKASSKRKARTRKAAQAKSRAPRKQVRANRRKATPRKAVRTQAKRTTKSSARLHARSAAKLAASVLSRRAAKVKTLASPVPVGKPPLKTAPKAIGSSAGKPSKSGTAKPGRGHGAASLPGNRPVVRVSRVPQFTYMRAPGADSGYDVGDSVEVFCDHEQDGERVRGWIKGVVVQVDNKLVAVQFRSNVFLTDGWMVPDRILWYSLSSDQIRNIGVGKKGARVAIPEY